MRMVFMGTPEFAVPSLLSLIKANHDIVGVFTQPDKPKGRGYKLTPPPVKIEAKKHGINIYQPNKIKDQEVIETLKRLNPEVIIVVAYGKILPEEIIGLPKYGCINIHSSLLPKYRGAAPIQWSVINGEHETGVTTMFMDKGLDTGDMLLKSSVFIGENETAGELHDKLSIMGAQLIVETLERLKSGDLQRIKQDDNESCYAPMLNKSLSFIQWNNNSKDIHNFVRGLNPWPVAHTKLDGKILKIFKTKLIDKVIDTNVPGKVLSTNPFLISCGNNTVLEVLEVQYEGKKRMSSQDFLRGNKVNLNIRLGE